VPALAGTLVFTVLLGWLGIRALRRYPVTG
jgi:hypothetical protein